ncbi:ABC transporter ATP-binding protein [Schlesneria sp.]|uniref:ABC transporter ATP-binding protein n=1 Tax=Schlesneria sp. TaxID=2762018 RepID=UPI002EFBD2CE
MVTIPSRLASERTGETLEIRQLRRTFGSVQAISDMNLTVNPGEIVALLGPSGCGKSTVLRLIAGLDQATSGGVWVGSERVTGPSAQRGLIFQSHCLFPWLTVRRNIEAGLIACGGRKKHPTAAADYMELMGLTEFADCYPSQISGGMAQRVALARALISHPDFLLLDEPLGALDQFTRIRMQDEILRVWEKSGTTMVLVTHDIDEAIYLCDRIAIMTPRPGRLESVIPVPFPRPRRRTDPEFMNLRAEILEMLHLAGNQISASG